MSSLLLLRLSRNCLQVSDIDKLVKFYCEALGMTVLRRNADIGTTCVGYPDQPQAAMLEFSSLPKLATEKYDAETTKPGRERRDVYWKIGLSLADVKLAQRLLLKKDISVSEPKQFRDIGYLSHLLDPEGFTIELLQHDFEANFKPVSPIPSAALQQIPVLGQITLRVADIDKNLDFYRDSLGMKLLSIQDVSVYGFTLYFLAWTGESPPNNDLASIENREWLWKRPYTVLELQHCFDSPPAPYPDNPEQSGFRGIKVVASGDLSELYHFLKLRYRASWVSDELVKVYDPNDVPIYIVQDDHCET